MTPLVVAHAPAVLDFFEDLGFWLEIAKWAILAYVAWWLYSWAQEKLSFSPLVASIVGLILIYYLVIEHPIIGTIGVLGWMFLTGGAIFIIGMFFPWINGLMYKMRNEGMQHH